MPILQIAQRQLFYCERNKAPPDSRSRRLKQRVMIGLIIDAIVRRLKPDGIGAFKRLYRLRATTYEKVGSLLHWKSLSAARKLSTCCRTPASANSPSSSHSRTVR
jgi:hypothetical protein